ncbi:hypothetical protein P5P86_11715 [Nocardioides sp. BP30]|uniref:hypothetical protein n=1 Tax=Nocardioides sp. BP30 TaxID=3036374 RepID=UPI0024682390|nr:hypothetical protein [Nocardioides sp. BP30]WGL50631.1 hypothetical protein P5P86_11715 [Nocardioides sp. BP30]
MSTTKLSKALARAGAHIRENAKAYVALAATTATGLAEITTGGETGIVLAAVGAVLTAYLTWRAPNADPAQVAADTEAAIAAVEQISPKVGEALDDAATGAAKVEAIVNAHPEIATYTKAVAITELAKLGVTKGLSKKRVGELRKILRDELGKQNSEVSE